MKKAFLLCAMFLVSCATASNGPMQRVLVDSDPRGAAVEIRDCGSMATKQVTTPSVVWVSRRSTQCRLVFRKPYYEEQVIRLSRHTSPAMGGYSQGIDVVLDASRDLGEVAILGSLLILPSLAVDAATGSMFELVPNDVVAQLEPKNQDWRERPPE